MKKMVFMFQLLRLQHYGRLEAIICLLAAKVCGTPIYWYPKNIRRHMREVRA